MSPKDDRTIHQRAAARAEAAMTAVLGPHLVSWRLPVVVLGAVFVGGLGSAMNTALLSWPGLTPELLRDPQRSAAAGMVASVVVVAAWVWCCTRFPEEGRLSRPLPPPATGLLFGLPVLAVLIATTPDRGAELALGWAWPWVSLMGILVGTRLLMRRTARDPLPMRAMSAYVLAGVGVWGIQELSAILYRRVMLGAAGAQQALMGGQDAGLQDTYLVAGASPASTDPLPWLPYGLWVLALVIAILGRDQPPRPHR